MPARLVSDNGEHVVIRPLVYVTESEARTYAKDEALPIIGCCCPACGDLSLQRQRVKRLIAQLEVEHPDVKNSMIRALGNVASRHLLDKRLNPLPELSASGARRRRGAAAPQALSALVVLPARGVAGCSCESIDEESVPIALLASLFAPGARRAAEAQQRPLVTEDPETIGAGLVLLEGGFDEQHEVFYPASGLQGNLLRLPTLGVSFGVSSIAELQIDGGLYNRLNVTSREAAPLSDQLDFTGDQHPRRRRHRRRHEDPAAVGKRRPSGVRRCVLRRGCRMRATRAGSASTRPTSSSRRCSERRCSRSASSATSASASWRIRSEGDRQNDVFTYGVSVARAVRQGLEVVGEVNGRLDTRDGEPPVGTESRGAMRVGGRFTRGTVRVDAGLIFGLTSDDPSSAFTAGADLGLQGVYDSLNRPWHDRPQSPHHVQYLIVNPCHRGDLLGDARRVPAEFHRGDRAQSATASSGGLPAEPRPVRRTTMSVRRTRHLVRIDVDDLGAERRRLPAPAAARAPARSLHQPDDRRAPPRRTAE